MRQMHCVLHGHCCHCQEVLRLHLLSEALQWLLLALLAVVATTLRCCEINIMKQVEHDGLLSRVFDLSETRLFAN